MNADNCASDKTERKYTIKLEDLDDGESDIIVAGEITNCQVICNYYFANNLLYHKKNVWLSVKPKHSKSTKVVLTTISFAITRNYYLYKNSG
jgi:hypothetical protein